MINSIPLLSILVVLPLVGALVLAFLKGHTAKLVGLGFALATTVLGVVGFVISRSATLTEQVTWIRAIGAHWALDLDPLAAVMVLLTVILTPVVLLAEWNVGEKEGARWGTGTFFALALALEAFSLAVFMASDLLVFYIMFEATLIPMYFMISGWGGENRAKAAVKFLLFSLAGGLVMLFGVAGVWALTAGAGEPSFLLTDLARLDLDSGIGRWLFVAFFFAFAVKAPMAGLHTWLPDTAEQATPGASTMLVGILDKIGTFGMIKICLMVFPEASAWATPVVLVWAIVSMIYGALMALSSPDLLRFVSYTSVSHFGFMVFGVFALTTQSLSGSVFYMLNHGFSTAALFLVVGFLVARRGSANIDAFGGVQKTAPVLAGVFLASGLSALALPGMSSFVSEFLVMAGAWQRYPIHTAVITIGMVLAAAYVLTVYKKTMTGPVTDQVSEKVSQDLDGRERLVVVPLLALLLILGFFPKPVLDVADDAAGIVMTSLGVTDPAPAIQEN
ncbi:NADH-quinone oxidoreductase subunit M [Arachnia propionica]|uniref:NADH-quinone oxidoreductase subunit M n=1 Tax=Arachnia propionica TaxID=1750 RepID=A0A3P1T3A8_9ACTN|nr:NADH-quinone oxidoreductase subunit M [Arachnia propionica]MDO5083292.1 NADH-quinone oxidoreductase subunit M [Arachnia propionica]RRD03784.1 NADH-quinone oxidoreductase subunit M [Arachnia propionica]